MITIFYDGKCNVCAMEINHYKRVAPKGLFAYQDITQSTQLLEQAGISLLQALQQLHVQDSNGVFHVGIDASILMWAQLPKFRWLAKCVAFKPIYCLAKIAYASFAKWRFNRLEHCQITAKTMDDLPQ